MSTAAPVASIAGVDLVPARGTHRRIQALVAIGWSQSRLGRMLGIDIANMSHLLRRDRVSLARHDAVAALYELLWNVEPPHASHHDAGAYTLARNYARARRWLPPLAWDDIDADVDPPVAARDRDLIDAIAVELAMAGEPVRLTPLERREAVKQLVLTKKHSDGTIAALLHIAERTAFRLRTELGLPAAVGADGRAVA